jgi:uncharacterized protein (TIGR02246 family)
LDETMKTTLHVPRVMIWTVFLFAATLSASTSPSQNQSASGDHAAAAKVLAGIVAADNAGDLDAVIASYADDAILLPPNDVSVVGKQAIRARYEEGFRHFRFDIVFTADETHIFGDLAFIRGTINGRTVPKGDEPSRKIHDKYIMVLHRQKDGWKIARLIWNASEQLPSTPK